MTLGMTAHLARPTALGIMALTLSFCTHKDLSDGLPGDDTSDTNDTGDTNDTADTGAPGFSEDWELEVAYGERNPVEPQACEGSDFRLPYTPGYTPDEGLRARAREMVTLLSTAEKAQQMGGTDPSGGDNKGDTFRQPDNRDKDIRGFQYRDGPRGLNLAAELQVETGHLGYATAFPVSMCRGAAFDLDLEYRVGKAQGDETLASKNTLLLAPTVNLLRHPAWGRAQETYGEDPYQLGRMGTAYTVGVQEHIPACVKHYIANNVEVGRQELNSEMDEQTLREIYGRAYEMIIQDGGVACVMAAYNYLNGDKCPENKHVLTEVLRKDFGFEGFVISDWWAMTNGWTANNPDNGVYKTVAKEGVQAGMDLEAPWLMNYGYIPSLVEDQTLDENVVNESVARILEQKYRFNVGDLATTSSDLGLEPPTVGWDRNVTCITENDHHIDIAEEAALKGAVLLKNDDDTLPLSGDLKKVAVLAATVDLNVASIELGNTVNFATDVLTGDQGSSRVLADPAKSVSPLEGIKEAVGSGVEVINSEDAADAADADVIIVVAGLTAADEGEEYTGAGDRKSFDLDDKIDGTPQNDLIAAAADLGKPVVVVLIGGSAIGMPWLGDVDAVLMAWYPGMVGGTAIGKLLFGEVSPSGKLPFTWPKAWEDEPQFTDPASVSMDYYAGYRYFEHEDIEPLFPFGYGLSYTEFEYLNLEVPCSSVTEESVIPVKVDVSNRGDVAADEIAFLFVRYPDAKDERRQVKQLKSFYRVSLDAGATKQIMLPIRMNDLRFYNEADNKWEIEKGTLEIMVGASAEDEFLTAEVEVQ